QTTTHEITRDTPTLSIDVPSYFAYGVSVTFLHPKWTVNVAPDGVQLPTSAEMVVSVPEIPRRLPPIVGPQGESITYTYGNGDSNSLAVEWADLASIEPRLLDGPRPQLTGYSVRVSHVTLPWAQAAVLEASETQWRLHLPQWLFDASSTLDVYLVIMVEPLSHEDVHLDYPDLPAWESTVLGNVHLRQLTPPAIAPTFLRKEMQPARHEFAARFVWQHTPVDNNIETLASPPQTVVSLWWAPPSQALQFVKNVTVTQTPGVNGQHTSETHWLFEALPPGQYKLFLWTQAHGFDLDRHWFNRRSVVVESEIAVHAVLNLNSFFSFEMPTLISNVQNLTFEIGGAAPTEQQLLLDHLAKALTPVAKNDFDAVADFSAVAFAVDCFVKKHPTSNFAETRTLQEMAND
ncbi:MAG: hypothetical protein MHM6MM_008808, partial [Cercozoa sp. M6MM]